MAKIKTLEEQYQEQINFTKSTVNDVGLHLQKIGFYAGYAKSLLLMKYVLGYMNAAEASEYMEKLLKEAEDFLEDIPPTKINTKNIKII